MPSAVVFGSNGYLGRHLTHFLINRGYCVTCSGRKAESIDNRKNYVSADLTDRKQLDAIDVDVDFVFMFAGATGTEVGFAGYNRFIDANERSLLNVLDRVREANSKARIIFPSTRLVYKGSDQPVKESDEKLPLTVYAVNKLSCEQFLSVYNNRFGIDYTIFRICVPYGNIFDDSYSYGTIGAMLKQSSSGSPLYVFGEGQQLRTVSHVSDISNIIAQCIENPKSRNNVYNIGGNVSSISELVHLIGERHSVPVISKPWPDSALRIESGSTAFNDEAILSTTHYKYEFSFVEWLKST